MGISKLTKGELKKIFLKPGIFVVTALLVVVLTLSALLFKPQTRNDSAVVNITGTKISQMYSNSYGATESKSSLSKEYLEKQYINLSAQIIDFYLSESSSNSKKQELIDFINGINDNEFNALRIEAQSDPNCLNEKTKEIRTKLKEKLIGFQNLYFDYINGTNGFYYLLMNAEDKTKFDVFLQECITSPFASTLTADATINKIYELDMFRTIKSTVQNMQAFLPKSEDLLVAKNNLNSSKTNIAQIGNEIEEFWALNKNSDDPNLKYEFRTLVTKYSQANSNAYKLTLFTIYSSALSDFSDDYIQSLFQFENEEYKTKYSIAEQKNICLYYLNTNKYAFEYASPLSLKETSNSEPNAYDFMFFALEFCSFIIVIYVVFLGATMIAGEYSNGTMKLLAIRPYSRKKILLSKLLATLFVGLIFLFITFVVTYIIGSILFGASSLPILLAFNAESVISVHPLISILMLFLCKTIEIIFYAIFAISISTWFKSNSGSVVVSLLLYFVSFILTMFTPSLGIIKYLPFVNTNLFGYFGSHLVSTTSNNLIVTMFSKVIANDMNFYISFAVVALFSSILYAITSVIFSKRDIK